MSETKTGVKIPVGWLRLDRGVTTLPGDWYWENSEWVPVCIRRPVRHLDFVIRRCRYRVGEKVFVFKTSGYLPKLECGTAIIDKVLASDHRGVQQVTLKKTGKTTDSILTACESSILAPVFAIWGDLGHAPGKWGARDIINTIDPTNDPNVAPYLASETIDEALQQAELTEAPQSEPWRPKVGDWVIRSGGIVSRIAANVEIIDGRVFYAFDDTTSKFDLGCLRPYSPRVGDQVIVLKKGSCLLGKTAKVLHASSVGIHVESLCETMRGMFKSCELLVDLPAKPHVVWCDPDHIADADKMVGNSSETPNGSADDRPQSASQLTIQPPLPKPKSLYIAGPMRGIAWFNYPMFDRIAKQLRDQGCEVISPADEDRKQDGFDPFENLDHAVPENCTFPRTMDFNKTVRRCLDAVMQCEEIVLLPGWERSSGAVAELTLAMWLNKRVRHVLIDEADTVQFVCFWKGLESLANDLCAEYLPEGDEPGDPIDVDDEDETADDILEEALSITRGSRNASYGPPDQDFRRTAGMWSALFAAKLREGETFEPRDVALAMILLKTSRETHQRKRDNWVDIAGYARCGSLCN